jgi:excisionase family DNA binding protein
MNLERHSSMAAVARTLGVDPRTERADVPAHRVPAKRVGRSGVHRTDPADLGPANRGAGPSADGTAHGVSVALGMVLTLLPEQVDAIAERVVQLLQTDPSVPPLELVTVRDAARALGVSPKTVYRAIAAGRLPAQRIGRAVRVPVEALGWPLHSGEVEDLPRARSRPGPPRREFTTLAQRGSLAAVRPGGGGTA